MANRIEQARAAVDACIREAYLRAVAAGELPEDAEIRGSVEQPKDTANGDFAANHAMASAKTMHMAPRKIAEALIGALTLTASADAITAVRFGAEGARDASALLDAAEAQLREYFARTRRTFDLPLDPRGTAFELRVWAALRTIPYGETRSYGTIAAAIGSPRAARAVGMANHRNPLPILIPCHRVIGADGSLTGYAGGLAAKRRLLALEGIAHFK